MLQRLNADKEDVLTLVTEFTASQQAMLDVGVSVNCCAFSPPCILPLTWTAVMYLRYGAYRRCVSIVVSVVSRTRRCTSVDCAITVV